MTFLTTFGVLTVVRLILFVLMWIIGFRGICTLAVPQLLPCRRSDSRLTPLSHVPFPSAGLFPNLFDDNQTFAGSFMPVFGKGDPVVVEEDSDDEYWEHMRKKKKAKEDDKDGVASPTTSEKRPKSDPKDRPPEPAFQFGWINVMLIFGVGAIACVKLGLFDGENVPDFIAKRDDLQYYFKSLAAPEPPPNATDGNKKDGEPELDPFAAPEEDGQRF